MKKFFNDFKSFISKGNVLDMAVGVIIGGAFGKIVTSLVNDIIMPLVALALGGKSMSGLVVVLNNQPLYLPDNVTLNPDALTWKYGNFIQTIIDFLIIAFCVFLIIRLTMKAKNLADKKRIEAEAAAAKIAAEEAAKIAPKPTTEDLLVEIRDLLEKADKKQSKTNFI